jgi:beta-phosphoglucomutase
MLKAIIFDYNGLLVDDLKLHEEAYMRTAADLGIPLARDTVRGYLSHTPDQKRIPFFGDISDKAWQEILNLKKRYYFSLLEETDIVFPDVEMVLKSLSEKFALALVSNTSREYFERSFPRHLAMLFRETIFAGEVDNPKPSPEPLLKVMESLGIGPDECCYVGDSVLDVQMAKTAGVRIFAVATGDNSGEELFAEKADCVLGSLMELTIRIREGEIQSSSFSNH